MTQQRAVKVQVPGPRTPLPATAAPALRGERVIVANDLGTYPGYRAWSEVYVAPDGHAYIDVVEERGWWAFELTQTLPEFWRWPAGAVWVD